MSGGPAPQAPRAGGPDPVGGIFLAWRRVLTATGRAARSVARGVAGSRPVAVAGAAARYLRAPAATLAASDRHERALLKEAGASALVIGVAGAFALGGPLGATWPQRFIAAGWTAMWALARLFIMRSVGRGALAERPSLVDDAWGPALLPFALALADPLPLAALAVSAWLTLRGLTAVGASKRDAGAAVAWAFGGQAAAELLAWAGRGGLVYLLALASRR